MIETYLLSLVLGAIFWVEDTYKFPDIKSQYYRHKFVFNLWFPWVLLLLPFVVFLIMLIDILKFKGYYDD